MKIYVAGAWIEKEQRAVPMIRQLRNAGITITHDWTVDEVASTVQSDAHLPPGERQRRAEDDLRGIREADYVWLLTPNERGASGAWTEFGYALGLGIPTLCSGRSWQRTIFTSKATYGLDSDNAALTWLVALASTFVSVVPATEFAHREDECNVIQKHIEDIDAALFKLGRRNEAAVATHIGRAIGLRAHRHFTPEEFIHKVATMVTAEDSKAQS